MGAEQDRFQSGSSADLEKAVEDACDWLSNAHEPEAENALALLREALRQREDRKAFERTCTGHLVHDEFTKCPVHDR